jgi:hypothetical protein
MDIYEELRSLVAKLREEQVPYALCGGLALAVYGITRATEDIDLLIEERSLSKVRAVAELQQQGTWIETKAKVQGAVIIHRLFKTVGEDSLVLDLLLVTPLTQPDWATRRQAETDFGLVQVVSPAGLIHLKKLRKSGQDQDDIRRLEELDE